MRSRFADLDVQFAIVFVVVAVFQTSIVAYARAQIYVPDEPSIAEIARTPFNVYLPPPVKIVEELETTKSAPVRWAPAALSPAQRTRSKGLVGVIGALRKNGGAVHDMFDEGRAVPSIADALRGAKGVELDAPGRERSRDGGNDTVEMPLVVDDFGAGLARAHKDREEDVRVDEESPPVVDGPISGAEISRVLKHNMRAMRDCYEHALKRDPTLAGKVELRFTIEESGRVEDVAVESTSLKSVQLAACIADRSKAWRFPKPNGEVVAVTYPIVFMRAE